MPPVRPLVLCLALTACAVDRTTWEPEVEQAAVAYRQIPAATQLPLDILVVVDRSAAMARYPHAIAEVGRFLDQSATSAHQDWHLGVVSADLADGGLFRTDGLVGAPFLIEWTRLDESRTYNYEGTLRDAFTRLVGPVSGEPSPSRPLAAITAALEHPAHQGFRRDDAHLAVMIVSAADDASDVIIEEHATWLGTSRPTVIVVAEASTPRLDAWASALTGRHERVDIGDEDPTEGLWPLAVPNWSGWGDSCLRDEPLDIDPQASGLQVDASVADILLDDTHHVVHERPIPACDRSTARPCWRVVEDRNNCSWADVPLSFDVVRTEYARPGTQTTFHYVTR